MQLEEETQNKMGSCLNIVTLGFFFLHFNRDARSNLMRQNPKVTVLNTNLFS